VTGYGRRCGWPGTGAGDGWYATGPASCCFRPPERSVYAVQIGPSRRLGVDPIRLLALDAEAGRGIGCADAGICCRNSELIGVAVVRVRNERLGCGHERRIPGAANIR
jgi:hypothetical protein